MPRSGWRTTSTKGTATSAKIHPSVPRELGVASRRHVRAHARVRMKISLKSSEGWKVSGPTCIQRRAPDTMRPSTKTVVKVSRMKSTAYFTARSVCW